MLDLYKWKSSLDLQNTVPCIQESLEQMVSPSKIIPQLAAKHAKLINIYDKLFLLHHLNVLNNANKITIWQYNMLQNNEHLYGCNIPTHNIQVFQNIFLGFWADIKEILQIIFTII